MGLLSKATGIQEIPLQPSKKKSDEWLDIADIDDEDSPQDVIEFDESDALGKLVSFIQNTVPNLHTPAKIFSLLEDIFTIQKGALLICDHVNPQFVPIAFSGYDKTTQSRLRIPLSIVSDLFTDKNEALFLGKDEISFLKPYFSVREFSLIDEICLYPFSHHDDDIIGILIATESSVIFSKRNTLFSDFVTSFDQISNLIYSSREKLFKNISQAKIKTNENLLQEIETSITKADENNTELFFLKVSVTSILEELRKNTENVDIFQIQNDIIHLLKTMMPESENIFLIDYGTLLIILTGRYHINEHLFTHQLVTSLKNLFSTIDTIELEDFVFLKYPDTTANAQDVIQRIIS